MDDLPAWIDIEAWQGWLEMRKSIKKPLTARAKKMAIHKLELLLQIGQDPTKVLDQSTFHNWIGLFPLKEEVYGQRQRPDRTQSFYERDVTNQKRIREEVQSYLRVSGRSTRLHRGENEQEVCKREREDTSPDGPCGPPQMEASKIV